MVLLANLIQNVPVIEKACKYKHFLLGSQMRILFNLKMIDSLWKLLFSSIWRILFFSNEIYVFLFPSELLTYPLLYARCF